MKKTLNPMLLSLLLTLILSVLSCNKEEIFVEPVTDVVNNDPTTEEPTNPEDTDTTDLPIIDTTAPCDFNLNTVEPNSTIIINCELDLEGASVNLPSNVTLVYEGGEIINGTINFSEGSVIDGDLLNSSITIGGSKPQVKDPNFDFIPSRWGIVEGEVSDEVALENKNILNAIFQQVKELGVTTFKIDEMDAYFKVSKENNYLPQSNRGDIFLPSNFNLVMTDKTHLRVQPNAYSFFVLLSVLDANNVTITGGNLHGDRDTHTYDGYGGVTGHGDSALIAVNAGVNTIIDGVNMQDSTADGIIVQSIDFTFSPNYKPSHGVVVKNCTINKSRRNNISIVNGYDIIVENCQILNAGVTTNNSVGTLPRLGIDIEALRSRDDNGNIILYELVKDVIIRNNIERGSDNGGFLVAIGQDTVIEGNDMENYIGYDIATGVKIRNNTITGTSEKHRSSFAIGAAGPGSTTTHDNEVSGNIISGYGTGITAYCYKAKIYDNKITDFDTAIFIPEIKNTEIYNNDFNSSIEGSRGIAAFLGTMENINIYGNTINVTSYPVSFINVNLDSGQENNVVTVRDNTFISPREAQVSNSNGIILLNNN